MTFRRGQAAALGAGLLVLVSVVYGSLRHAGFISLDDPQYVVNNARVVQGVSLDGFRWALTSTYAANWHPLTWMSHMLDAELFGINAGAHHMTNVVLHAASTLLLFCFLRGATHLAGRSAFVAALFAVHPLHVESVAWIAERKDVLSTFFWMLTLLLYSKYAKHPQLIRMLPVLLVFSLGLLSKPMLVTLPFTLLLLDYWPLGRLPGETVKRLSAWGSLVREKIPMFVLAAGSAWITLIAQRRGGAVIAIESLPVSRRVGSAVVSYTEYLTDTVWPSGLAIFYPFVEPAFMWVMVSALLIAAVSLMAIVLARRLPYLPVGWFWYVGTLIPVIGLVQVGAQGRADRYTYVPLVGIFILVAWGMADLARTWRVPRPAVWLAGITAIVVCAAASATQVGHWRNDLTVWGHAVSVTSRNYRAENHLGIALTDRGRLAEGIGHYEAALGIWPDYPEAHNNLGTARVEQGRIDDAIHEFGEAARLKPGSSLFHYNLGVVLATKGDTTGAIRAIERAAALAPQNADYVRALEILRRR